MFNQEIAKLRFKQVKESDVKTIAERARANLDLQKLSGEIEGSVEEYVQALAECTLRGEPDDAAVTNFLRATRLLEGAIRDDPELIDYYEKQTGVKKEFFLPVSEIALLIGSALVSGAFSEIARMLVRKIAAGRAAKKEDVRQALELLLSNPILQLLEEQKDGMAAEEAAELLGMQVREVEYYLQRFEQEGWVRKGPNNVWITVKTRAEIIEEFLESAH